MANAEKLAKNVELLGRLSVAMAREIDQRLMYGDVMLVGAAAERLAAEAGYVSIDGLLKGLRRADGSNWLNLVMVHWGKRQSQADLKVATGRDRTEWLELERTHGWR
jgi:hypothetical protein